MEPLVVEQYIKSTPERIWKALTDADEMRQWYFDLKDFKAEPGFEFSFQGKGHKGEAYTHLCRVTVADPFWKLQYSWAYAGFSGSSLVTFELFPQENGQTLVRVTHSGLNSFPQDNPDFAENSFRGGWTMLITELLPKHLGQAV